MLPYLLLVLLLVVFICTKIEFDNAVLFGTSHKTKSIVEHDFLEDEISSLSFQRVVRLRHKVSSGFAPLSFEVCEGLSNQRIAIIHGMIIAYISKRPVILPELYSSFNVSMGKKIAFDDMYNVSHLRNSLAGDIVFWDENTVWEGKVEKFETKNAHLTKYQWLSRTNKTVSPDTALKLSCTFNSISIDDQLTKVLWNIDRSIVLQNELQGMVDKIKKAMPDGFTALHYRAEQDWLDHCKKWENIRDGVIRNNCIANTGSIATVLALEKVSTLRPIYLAGGYTPAFISKSPLKYLKQNYNIITKSSFITFDDTGDTNLEQNLIANREMFAAIDYAVCAQADLFIGNSVSTFSAMIELRRLQDNKPTFHYNGGNIPLEIYMPVNIIKQHPRLKWVFCMVLNGQTSDSYLQMAKVAVVSARENTLLEPIFVAMVTDEADVVTVNFIRWLQSYGVHVIRHTPVWAQLIKDEMAKGTFDQNNESSPLYTTASSLIATFMRIDFPILGFVDEYILYADVDVMFVRDVSLDDFAPLPRYYTMGTESIVKPRNKKRNWFAGQYGNAGVILYNIPNMRSTYKKFLEHVFSASNLKRGLHYGIHGPGDQGAYNSFYNLRNYHAADTRSAPFFNWRPFWKDHLNEGKTVSIVHWHGPKPKDYAGKCILLHCSIMLVVLKCVRVNAE